MAYTVLTIRTVDQFVAEWDALFNTYHEVINQECYLKWRGYLRHEISIANFESESNADFNAGYITNYAYLRLWGFVGSGCPDYYIVDKYGLYGAVPKYQLSLGVQPQSDAGFIYIQPGGSTFESGTDVALTATAYENWAFSAWTGDLNTTTNPVWLHIDGNKTVNAVFVSTIPPPPPPSPAQQMINGMMGIMPMVAIMGVLPRMMSDNKKSGKTNLLGKGGKDNTQEKK